MEYSFKGGIKLIGRRNKKADAIIRMPAPQMVKIPMADHAGGICEIAVKIGDEVKCGQRIGIAAEGGSDIHSPVSGKISAIEEMIMPKGEKAPSIVIENDFREMRDESIKPFGKKISEATADEIIKVIKDSGIVDTCGETAPLYKKLDIAGFKIKNVIINLAESDPYLSSRYKMAMMFSKEILGGVKIILRAAGSERAIFAIERSREDLADKFISLIGDNNKAFGIKFLKPKYPQDGERELILALRKKEIPCGKSSKNIGSIVLNAETLKAVYDAFVFGMPYIERNISISGNAIGDAADVIAPIGTLIEDLINFCGGYKRRPERIICGGIMKGYLQENTASSISKDIDSVICLASDIEIKARPHCINCGRCISVCPMKLLPYRLSKFASASDTKSAIKYGIESCNECGCCTYICPGRVDILGNIKNCKEQIRLERE